MGYKKYYVNVFYELNMCRSKNPQPKKGILYSECQAQMRPFDVIFFKGDALFSALISVLEKHGNKIPNSGEFTHVAMIVNSDVLNHEKILPGKQYILESVVGGSFAHNVKNINNKVVYGVQIRDLEEVVTAFDKSNDTIVAWGKLINNPLDNMSLCEIRTRLSEFCNTYVGKTYDANPFSLLSSVFPCLRKCRNKVETLCGTSDWYFCSEIVALAFKHFRIYPDYVNEKNVLPRDLIHPEADVDKMPTIISTLTYVTTPIHQATNKCRVV